MKHKLSLCIVKLFLVLTGLHLCRTAKSDLSGTLEALKNESINLMSTDAVIILFGFTYNST